jgi:hypothetical protein
MLSFLKFCAIILLIGGKMELKNSSFYKKSTQMLADFVANGGDVSNLTKDDQIYKYIKNSKVFDADGKLIDLETKFTLLGYPRKSKISKNLREDLINEIREYLINGGSFHIERKKLPFYERLHSYRVQLLHKGINLTHEQIMREDLGFHEFSDTYFRCQGIFQLKHFRNENGFVDSYKSHIKFNNYIKELSQTYNLPIPIIITLLADEKCTRYEMVVDKIKYAERLLKNYATKHGTFVGIKRTDKTTYEAFEYLTKYYSDGTEAKYSKADWLSIFGLGDVEHRFRDKTENEIVDVESIVEKLKKQFGDNIVIHQEINKNDYRTLIKKAVALNISVAQLLNEYGLKSNGISSERLSRTWLNEVPYLKEMKKTRDEIIAKSSKPKSKEEEFEIKLKAVISIYEEFKEKLEQYLPDEYSIIQTSEEQLTQ